MKKHLLLLALLFSYVMTATPKVQYIWPKDGMPDAQPGQTAVMTDISRAEGFDPDKWRRPFLEWYAKPAHPVGACAILISGGGYNNTCDVKPLAMWAEKLTAAGIQCVKLVYRTPRPEGLPYYMTAWEDGQRAVRLVRKEAARRGLDPERIGTVSMSAGSHMALMLATCSQTPSYERLDAVDDIPCHINFALAHAPAYMTTDGLGRKASRQGFGPDVKLAPEFKFDARTCPVCLMHGADDPYSPNGSTLVYRQLRRMKIPAELHLYADRKHGVFGLERGIEFLRQLGILEPLEPEVALMDRFTSDSARCVYTKEPVWPEGKMPDRQEEQCEPYLEWHIPAHRTTDAIQIIYSGGGYNRNNPDAFEVAPARRYLNAKGMTVVTVKYRTPRPKDLAKHITAWQDLQRAVRIVRKEAASKGLNPDKIGIMGSSAGGHLTLMGVTSSRHRSYLPIDETDKIPCNVQWGVGIYPAYVLSDGWNGHNKEGGNEDRDILAPEFVFDPDTAPMVFIHGDADKYAAMGSVKVWEKMRAMGIQSELHTLALRPHCFQREACPGTGSYTWLDRIWEFLLGKGIVTENK